MSEGVKELNDAELFESLDWNRQIVVRKLEGLTFEQATAVVTPSGLTLLGVAKHLAWVERAWFEHHLLGAPEEAVDIDASFQFEASTTVADVIADYQQSCARARKGVEEAASLDVHTINPHWFFGIVTLRWILLHMIRETARHAGHMDILRELTDGQTGDVDT
jgi:uncharacterized damage-inducible protein DinB